MDVGANLACCYFSAKNSAPAGKRENTVEAASPPNPDHGLISSYSNGSLDPLKIFGMEHNSNPTAKRKSQLAWWEVWLFFFKFIFCSLCSQSRAETFNTPDNLKPSITSWWTCNVLQWKVTLQPEAASRLRHVGELWAELPCEFIANAEFWPNPFKPWTFCRTQGSGDGRVTQRVLWAEVLQHLLAFYLLWCLNQAAGTWLKLKDLTLRVATSRSGSGRYPIAANLASGFCRSRIRLIIFFFSGRTKLHGSLGNQSFSPPISWNADA